MAKHPPVTAEHVGSRRLRQHTGAALAKLTRDEGAAFAPNPANDSKPARHIRIGAEPEINWLEVAAVGLVVFLIGIIIASVRP